MFLDRRGLISSIVWGLSDLEKTKQGLGKRGRVNFWTGRHREAEMGVCGDILIWER
jgi:hypothetical protein